MGDGERKISAGVLDGVECRKHAEGVTRTMKKFGDTKPPPRRWFFKTWMMDFYEQRKSLDCMEDYQKGYQAGFYSNDWRG